MRRLALLLLALLAGLAGAQPELTVQGVPVPGVANLRPGTSYAPAAAYAAALGAEMRGDAGGGLVTLTLGGRIVQLEVDDGDAVRETAPTRVDGAVRPGLPAVLSGGLLYLPVKVTAEALGASVAYLPEPGRVVVVLPRATLTRAAFERGAEVERLRIELDAPAPVAFLHDDALGVAQLRLERTDAARAQQFFGDVATRVTLVPGPDGVDVRATFPPGTLVRRYVLPAEGGGATVALEFRPGEAAPEEARRARVVLDAGHGGGDPGRRFGSGLEKDLTLALALRLAEELRGAGFDVDLTRAADTGLPLDARARLGGGADLFVSLHAADLPPGRYRLYYLAEADDAETLELAVRRNAESALAATATDALRRRLLLDLVPDLELGRRYAENLVGELFDLGGYQAEEPRGAPLAVLEGAAGRGLLFEFSPADLADERLAQALAATLTSVLGRGGF